MSLDVAGRILMSIAVNACRCHRMSLAVVGCHWMLVGVARCCWMLLAVPGCIGYHKMSLDVIGCHCILVDVVGCHWMSLIATGSCSLLLDVIGRHWTLPQSLSLGVLFKFVNMAQQQSRMPNASLIQFQHNGRISQPSTTTTHSMWFLCLGCVGGACGRQ